MRDFKTFVRETTSNSHFIAGQRLILIGLSLHPEGLTLKELMVGVGVRNCNRKMIQRQMNFLLDQGLIVREIGTRNAHIYTLKERVEL